VMFINRISFSGGQPLGKMFECVGGRESIGAAVGCQDFAVVGASLRGRPSVLTRVDLFPPAAALFLRGAPTE
jgi:hypothetical protein